jgi:hypothetical protein
VRFALAEHEGHIIGVICGANARGLPLDPHRLHQKKALAKASAFFNEIHLCFGKSFLLFLLTQLGNNLAILVIFTV